MKKLSLSNRIIRDIATDWNELTFAQLNQLSALFSEGKPLNEVKIKLFIILAGLHKLSKPSVLIDGDEWHWFAIEKQKLLISVAQLNWASNQVLNFFKSVEKKEIIKYYPFSTLTRNIFPPLLAGEKKLIGPGDGLTNITYKEFTHAENFHYSYTKSKNEADLNKLIAVLFRPIDTNINETHPDYKGDLRIQFNDFQIEYYAKSTAELSPTVKQSILYFYEGCKLLITKLFPNVFRQAETSEEANETDEVIDIAVNMICIVDELTSHIPAETEKNMNESAYMVLSSINNLLTKREKGNG